MLIHLRTQMNVVGSNPKTAREWSPQLAGEEQTGITKSTKSIVRLKKKKRKKESWGGVESFISNGRAKVSR